MSTLEMARKAKAASILLSDTSLEDRNRALEAMANALQAQGEVIFQANRQDLQEAGDSLGEALRKRLLFDQGKLQDVVAGLHALRKLPDPLGRVTSRRELAEGLHLRRVTCPIGVIGIIFEARPDALVQISSLCLKSGNAVLLKGGREAFHTNRLLAEVIAQATCQAGIPREWLQLLESREEVQGMLSLNDTIDLIVPRGSNAFVRHIMENTTIPVLGHSAGLCHLYLDESADPKMAAAVAVDAKTQGASACNAIETLLVNRKAAPRLLPQVCQALEAAGVELRGDEECRRLWPAMKMATPEDWATEYLSLVLSVKLVEDVKEAIDHINHYGSHHTDAIVTESAANADLFQRRVDSADVFWNASTRFADGFRFGLGAEVGISTSKIHARGPVGLEGLTIYKWLLEGQGDTVAPFAQGQRQYTHREEG